MQESQPANDVVDTPAWHRIHTRPSLRVAFLASLMVHTFFVFVLYRVYTEIVGGQKPPIQIVATARAPRPVVTPVFAASPLAEVALPDEAVRPMARPIAFPYANSAPQSIGYKPRVTPVATARRSTAMATLPVTPVVVPQMEEQIASSPVEPAPTASHSGAAVAHAASLPEPSLRFASRPVYRASEHRDVGMAIVNSAAISGATRRPTPSFANRGIQARLSRESRATIELGLEFLARVQQDDGRWRFNDLRGIDVLADAQATQRADAAATGLVLLAFLGAGHDHFDGRFQHVVRDGLDYLKRIQQDRGNFFWDDASPEGQITRFYSHGIATLAVCEALGMTGDPQLRMPAQHAMNYLAGSSDPSRNTWRYLPGVNSDATATGWQLAALQTGQLAGLHVEPSTLASVRECLAMCRVRELRDETLLADEQPATTVNTAVGLAVDLHLGDPQQEAELRNAADYLLARTPEVRADGTASPPTAGDPESVNPRRDHYYWYYGSEAMHRLGGNDWQAWSADFYPHLMETQIRTGSLSGSWDPTANTSTYGNDCAGRLYVTAMNLLSLEIQQRQLPVRAAVVPQAANPQ